jgi:hypothetical protein
MIVTHLDMYVFAREHEIVTLQKQAVEAALTILETPAPFVWSETGVFAFRFGAVAKIFEKTSEGEEFRIKVAAHVAGNWKDYRKGLRDQPVRDGITAIEKFRALMAKHKDLAYELLMGVE